MFRLVLTALILVTSLASAAPEASTTQPAPTTQPQRTIVIRPLHELEVTFGTLKGRLTRFDNVEMWIALPDGTEQAQSWKRLKPEWVNKYLSVALDPVDGEGWAVGAKVMEALPGGETLSQAAWERAVALGVTLESITPPADASTELLVSVATVESISIDPPLPATGRLRDGKPMKGLMIGFDAENLHTRFDNEPQLIPWTNIRHDEAGRILNRSVKKTDAQGSLLAGEVLRQYPETWAAAMLMLDRAERLDASLKPLIDPLRRKDDGRVVQPWPELNEVEAKRATEALKKLGEEAARTLKLNLKLHETEHYLIYTDTKPIEVAKYERVLTNVYKRLSEVFDVPRGKSIWRGKAIVFIFSREEDFVRCENEVMKTPDKRRAAGRCYYTSAGEVKMTVNGSNPSSAVMSTVAHELTHAFAYRFRTRQALISWVNEGLAELTSAELTATADQLQHTRSRAQERVRSGAIKWDAFFSARSIEFPDYPVAQTLAQYMVGTDRKRYLGFLRGMKDGMSWDQSLEANFGTTQAQLVEAYKKYLGIRTRPPANEKPAGATKPKKP